MAVAAPVIIFVAPGPIDERQANVDSRIRDFANAGIQLSAVVDPAITARGSNGQPRLVLIEGGMKIRQLLADLSTMQPPLAVPAMGALSRQSVVGALATGTHGSEIDRQPLADAIRAVWLVGPGGQEWWIERTNRWSVDAATLKATIPTLCSDAVVVFDDDVFYSAITGVGRMGVVYAVVLEVERDYWIQERRRPAGEPWPPLLAALTTSVAAGYESPSGIFTTRVPGGITFLQVALSVHHNDYGSGAQGPVGEDTPLAQLEQETVEATAWAIPWMQLLVLLILALLIFAIVKLVRRQRARHAAAIDRAREEGARAAAARGAHRDPETAAISASAAGTSQDAPSHDART